jgi:hypothetical protein
MQVATQTNEQTEVVQNRGYWGYEEIDPSQLQKIVGAGDGDGDGHEYGDGHGHGMKVWLALVVLMRIIQILQIQKQNSEH